jgi:hypothetical protein
MKLFKKESQNIFMKQFHDSLSLILQINTLGICDSFYCKHHFHALGREIRKLEGK